MRFTNVLALALALALVLSSLLGVCSLAVTGFKHYKTGIHDYWTYVTTSHTDVTIVPNTRSYHYIGTENVLNSPAYSKTKNAYSSLNQYDGIFEDQANDLGVFNSRQHSISNGQRWTISSSKATGYYSLGIYWPGSSVTYTTRD